MPSYNRPAQLAECLEYLCLSNHCAFEVIVVDDGSKHPLGHVADLFAQRIDLRILRQKNTGPASARNAGAIAARGEILAFTDDDCRPAPDWLDKLTEPLKKAPDVLAGGLCLNGVQGSAFSEASQDIVSFLYANAREGGNQFEFFTSNNLACNKHQFLAIGGFDTTFPLAAGEDREFGIRWRRTGGTLLCVEDAVVVHFHYLDLRRFWLQQSNYGRGAHHMRKRFAERGEPVIPFGGLSFYFKLAAFPFRSGGRHRMTRAALVILSQFAMVVGVLREGMLSRSREITP